MTEDERLLLEFPSSIETDRLIIRPPRESDAEAVAEAKYAARISLAPWFPWAQEDSDFSVGASLKFLRTALSQFYAREDFTLLVFEKETGDFIACSGLHPRDWSIGRFEVGYWSALNARGKGYITESSNAITRFAFDEFNAKSMIIRADDDNFKSRAIPERLNFELDGILRASEVNVVTGEPRDVAYYSCLNTAKLPALKVRYNYS